MDNKIAIKTNEKDRVIFYHYRPWELSSDYLKKCILIDKDSSVLNNRPSTEPHIQPFLCYDGTDLYWGYEFISVDSIAKYKLSIQLKRQGLLNSVEQLISDDEEMSIAWTQAAYIDRNSNGVNAIKQHMNLSDNDTDEIFAKAFIIEL